MRVTLPVKCLLIAFALSSVQRASAQDASQPNIVLIIADDLSWHDIGVYGNDQIVTPHIDRLAAQGTLFTHAFQAAPMCSPTRHNLYTGLYPVNSGAYPNHTYLRGGVRTVFEYLRETGYRVGLSGKQHVGPPEAFPYERLSANKSPDFEQIREFVVRDTDSPFFLVVASNQPHTPWTKGDQDRYDPDALILPPYFVDTPQTRQALAAYYAEITHLDAQVGRVMHILEESKLSDQTIVLFTSEQGSGFPMAKWTLYDAGIRTALIVRWPGRIQEGRRTGAMVEYSDVTPTVLEMAGLSPPEGLDGRSFLPVLRGERETHKEHVFGIQTTRGIFNGTGAYPIRSVRTRNYKYIRNLLPDSTFRNTVTERRDFWESWVAAAKDDPDAAEKVRRYQHRPAEELYDLKADPYESQNLASDPRFKAVKLYLEAELDAWMARQGDEGVPTEMQALDRQRLNRGD